MKSKKVLSLALAFLLSLSFVFFLPSNSVSAASFFPDTNYVSNFSESQSVTLLDQFYSNTSVINRGFDKYNSVICISYSGVLQLYNILCIKEGSFQDVSSYYYYRENRVCSSLVVNRSDSSSFIYGSAISSISSFDFSVNSSINPTDDYVGINFAISYNDVYFVSTLNSSNNYKIADTPFSATNWLYNYGVIPPFEPVIESDYNLHFSYDTDDFYTWIINNNKLAELPSYIIQSKLKSFLNFYKSFGSSSTNFFKNITDWFSFVSIPNQTFDNVSILKGSIDKLYQEYLRYLSNNHAYWPGATKLDDRNTIDTVTDNNNLTLVTDDVNDDLITKLLRDILRGVIAISNQVYSTGQNIIGALDSLSFDVVVSNNGGVPSGTDINPLLQKMDDIIDALGSDTVSVEIDQNTIDDTDQFFDDWNLEFQSALDDKFPVASQLSSLFTDFWEKCGIDVDNDGETFEYYNPGVLESRSVVSSLDSAGTSESDIVTDFLNQFDDSDPAFLDDASFNSVPDLSVSIGGSDVSIFDFRVYAKYRDKIHFIISLVIWSLYLLHLYKALPTIIGQVADVAVKITDD